MKKNGILLMMVLCMLMTGCSNKFAEEEYYSVEKMIKSQDRYTKVKSVFNQFDGGYSLTVSQFDGRQTLWTDVLEENQSVEIEFSLELTMGQAKIVHVDEEGNVTTLIECTPETSTEGYVTKTVSMPGGENKLKIVGFDCKDIVLEMLF